MTSSNKKRVIVKLEELKTAVANFTPKELARFRSWFIKETLRRERLQDQADLQAFEARCSEPTISYEKFRKELKTKR